MSRLVKVALAAIGVVVVLILLLVWGAVSWGQNQMGGMEEDAAEYGQWAMTEIGQAWSPEVLKSQSSAEFLSVMPSENSEAWLDALSNLLGPVKTVERGKAEVELTRLKGKDAFRAVYTSTGEFTKRKAEVRMVLLLKQQGGWQIASIGVMPDGEPPQRAGASEASSPPSADPGP
jgi:hypothetical protein